MKSKRQRLAIVASILAAILIVLILLVIVQQKFPGNSAKLFPTEGLHTGKDPVKPTDDASEDSTMPNSEENIPPVTQDPTVLGTEDPTTPATQPTTPATQPTTPATQPTEPTPTQPSADNTPEKPTLPDNPTEKDLYFFNNSEVLEIKPVTQSTATLTEAEACTLLEELGFDTMPITCDRAIDGTYLGEFEADPESDTRHPVYSTYYISETGVFWTINIIDGQIFAIPTSYNAESGSSIETIISETNSLTSYDDIGNKFYITIPFPSAVILQTIPKIEAATLDTFTF